MKYLAFLLLALTATTAVSAAPGSSIPEPGPDGKYTLTAPGIKAKFIPFAAAITNLWVQDKNGIERDIVVGYDHADNYPADAGSHNGAVPGRYAGRIGNATYSIDGVTYHTEQNDGPNTLHSGTNGWGYRKWNITAVSSNCITFSIIDPHMSSEGMPGTVIGKVTYTLGTKKWKVYMEAISPEKKSPILLTQHTYWNLDAFANPATDRIWNHTYYTPFSRRILEPDANMAPTGNILPIAYGSIDDFWSEPKQLGAAMSDPGWVGHCGSASGCEGYNNMWIVDKARSDTRIAATLASNWSGIKVDIRTDQEGLQLYSCYWSGGTAPIKSTQGGPASNGFVNSGGCVAIEAQDWSDGINNPQWGRKQIYGPGDKFTWNAEYTFSTF
ncbi:galactose mutarotase-like domain-containing protein [Kalaharituber pfeilii]|nr:galactose mutarotase-like domain-containing protein [Kalaharituber pfeilii]